MIKRTIEISREPAHLAVRREQLLLRRDGQTLASIPCEDVGVVVVDHPATTYTHAALAELARRDAVVVVCGQNHLPAALLLPLVDHSEVVSRVADQLAASRPLRKRLWKQLVRAKIRGQARNLPKESPARSKLLQLARQVRSGDPTNIEAQAAKVYWRHWLDLLPSPNGRGVGGEGFHRDTEGDGLNALLNYGYAIVRAAVARALVAGGLLPMLGLSHCNRSNPFCLADDLVEPLRPLVDRRARELYRQAHQELTQEVKAPLLEILAEPVRMGDRKGPLMVHLHRMVASLVRCFRGQTQRLEIPEACT